MPEAAPERALAPRVPILAYHAVGDGPAPLSMPPGRFREHLHSLRDGGWRTLSLAELLVGHARGGWPARRVVLTFDDGFAHLDSQAWPEIARLGFTAILFAVSGRLGGRSDWPGWPPAVEPFRMMDAHALRDAADAGIEIGAHSVSHPRLSRTPAERVEREIADSQAHLEDAVGRPVRAFAYPFGDAPPAAVDAVARHFDAGFGIELAFATARSRVAVIERIDAHYLRGRPRLTDLGRASTRGWLAARSVLRRARRAGSHGPGRESV
ncbi:MAG: polysaccharide deacetylase family protein [Vicinamibacterales bacterium]